MEKIQAAIAKARAARPDADFDKAPEQAVAGAGGSPHNDSSHGGPEARLTAAWAALPLFAPDPGLLERNHIVTGRGSRGSMEFDMMRTKLLQQIREKNWRRVAITSPGAGNGKSTIALNLGFSLARLPEIRTLVAEVDLRRPSLARMLGLQDRHDFASVLAGKASLADNAIRCGENLAVSTNYGPHRNPAELLYSSTTGPSLKEIEEAYAPDVILFDTSPMLVSDDTIAFMGQVDCALLVAAAGITTVSEIDKCERELAAQTNVLGVVLNKCRDMGPDYGYGYYDKKD